MNDRKPGEVTDLKDWEVEIVDGAMLYASTAGTVISAAFSERVRAMQVMDASAAEVEASLDAVRQKLADEVQASHDAARRMAGDWWA